MNNYTAVVNQGKWYTDGNYAVAYRNRVDLTYTDQRVGVFFVDEPSKIFQLAKSLAKGRGFPTQSFNLTIL